MNVQEKLLAYYDFSSATVERVAESAERRLGYKDFHAFLGAVGIYGTEDISYDGDLPVKIVDIRPDDSKGVLVMHLPMANPLDPNQLYQVASVAGSNPNLRIIAAGNPSVPGKKSGLLKHSQRKVVAHGNLLPTVEPVLKYLSDKHNGHIEAVNHYGYSYGADKALSAIANADQETEKAIIVEPASGMDRSLVELGKAFASTDEVLGSYVSASNDPNFEAARGDKESVGANYVLGLLRLSNIAVARALSKDGFEGRLDAALLSQQEMDLTLVWGSDSELAIDSLMVNMAERQKAICGDRFTAQRLLGQRHAMANDIDLQNALIIERLAA